MSLGRILLPILAALLVLPAMVTARPRPVAGGATLSFTVTSTADTHDATPGDGLCADSSGNCTLRAAIEEANAQQSGSTVGIIVPAGTYALTLGKLALTANTINIAGAGAAGTTITGQGRSEVATVAVSATATLGGVTIRGGNATKGGGIANAGALTIANSIIISNTAPAGNGGGISNAGALTLVQTSLISNTATNGGSLDNTGVITLTASTLISNTATNNGGGIHNSGSATLISSTLTANPALGGDGGGIDNTGALTLTNSTLSGNTAANGGGGGIFNFTTGALTLTNSTLTGNMAVFGGGGIDNTGALTLTYGTLSGNTAPSSGGGVDNTGLMALRGTIVAANTAGGDCAGAGAVTDQGYNLDGDGSCILTRTTDLTSTNPLLGPLAGNGGPTQTMALLAGSPAIDHGGTSATGCPATDQRGIARPQGPACDIGAYEAAVAAPPTATPTATPSPSTPTPTPTHTAVATRTDTPTPTDTPVPATATARATQTSSATPSPTTTAVATPTATPSPMASPTSEASATLPLPAGWSLITLPLLPTSPLLASNVVRQALASSGGHMTAIQGWTGTGWTPPVQDVNGTVSGQDFALRPGQGYFVLDDAPGSLTVTGTVPTAQPPQTLVAGWNLIGVPDLGALPSPDAAGLFASLAAAHLQPVAAQGWTGVDWTLPAQLVGGRTVGNFALDAHSGYFVLVHQGGTWPAGAGAARP